MILEPGRKQMRVLALLILCSIIPAGSLALASGFSLVHQQTAARSHVPIVGHWQGMVLIRGNWRFLEAEFVERSGTIQPKIDLPQARQSLSGFELSPDSVRFRLTSGNTHLNFTGTINKDHIAGQVSQDEAQGSFQLIPVHELPPQSSEAFAGTYQTSGGSFISIALFDFGDGKQRLAYLDSASGHWGILFPTSADSFTFGSARSGRFPITFKIKFVRDNSGKILGLVWNHDNSKGAAKKVELYKEEQVEFSSGTIKLSGVLIKPLGTGSHPAVVMIHSSGHQSRNGPVAYFRLIANLLASNGIAVLAYDKRGVGKSTGNWGTASFDDLADDAIAATHFLKTRGEIDRRRIGLWGLSQGGWLAPLAASKARDIAFVVIVSGAAVSPIEQEIDRVNALLRANGFSRDKILEVNSYLQTYFNYVRTGEGWDTLLAVAHESRSKSWAKYVHLPTTPNSLSWWRLVGNFDPKEAFSKMNCPVLTINGEKDQDIEAKESKNIFERVSTNSRSDHKIYSNADHYLLVHSEKRFDIAHPHLASGYLRQMIRWISQQARAW